MKKSLYRLFLLFVIFFSGAVLLNSCSKSNTNPVTPTPANPNIFDHQLTISFAKDNGVDRTADYTGFTFQFPGPYSALSGNANAWNNFLAVNGAWSINTAYDKITFALPTGIFTQFDYLNKQWQIVAGTSTTIILTATNGENDEVRFTVK